MHSANGNPKTDLLSRTHSNAKPAGRSWLAKLSQIPLWYQDTSLCHCRVGTRSKAWFQNLNCTNNDACSTHHDSTPVHGSYGGDHVRHQYVGPMVGTVTQHQYMGLMVGTMFDTSTWVFWWEPCSTPVRGSYGGDRDSAPVHGSYGGDHHSTPVHGPFGGNHDQCSSVRCSHCAYWYKITGVS
jgi:hypothetical protein